MSRAEGQGKADLEEGVRGGPGEVGVVKVLLAEDEESFVDALMIGLDQRRASG